MKPEAQRIAIAEACGITVVPCTCGQKMNATTKRHLPDYLNDLNAVHEAEKVLTKDQHDGYRDNLKEICVRDWFAGNKHYTPFPDCATAAQRCEALLKTLGKWVPTPNQPTL